MNVCIILIDNLPCTLSPGHMLNRQFRWDCVMLRWPLEQSRFRWSFWSLVWIPLNQVTWIMLYDMCIHLLPKPRLKPTNIEPFGWSSRDNFRILGGSCEFFIWFIHCTKVRGMINQAPAGAQVCLEDPFQIKGTKARSIMLQHQDVRCGNLDCPCVQVYLGPRILL